jgi:hypothetical protein
LTKTDRIRVLIKVNYGFYVIERVLLRSTDEQVKGPLRDEVFSNIGLVATQNLKNKWLDLLERSRLGLLSKASCERQEDDTH